MFWIFKKAKYPPQQLTYFQNALLSCVDVKCQETLSKPADGDKMFVHKIDVPFQYTVNQMVLRRYVFQHLPKEGGYIPRSVALIQSGLDWHILIGVYGEQAGTDIELLLFIDALTRTNTARTSS